MTARHYLLVDDNKAFAENLAEILRDVGNEITISQSGPAALELLKQQRFDALVTDMRMPEMGGAQLVHEVRRMDPGLPAVVVSAYTAEKDLEIARREGLLAVLPKPVPIPRLSSLLSNARRDALVALVEDDESLADNLSELLTGAGFTVMAAHSLAEAESLFGATPFAAVVDMRIPGADDGAAARHITERFPGVPLVVITGHVDVLDKIPRSANETLMKPFETAKLLAKLDALHQKAAEQR